MLTSGVHNRIKGDKEQYRQYSENKTKISIKKSLDVGTLEIFAKLRNIN